jgi:hypothetical protein
MSSPFKRERIVAQITDGERREKFKDEGGRMKDEEENSYAAFASPSAFCHIPPIRSRGRGIV